MNDPVEPTDEQKQFLEELSDYGVQDHANDDTSLYIFNNKGLFYGFSADDDGVFLLYTTKRAYEKAVQELDARKQ